MTLLTTPEFKAFLASEARREGVSVAELVRTRCERRPSEEERTLQDLTLELQHSVEAARRSLREGLAEVESALADLRAGAVASAARNATPRTGRAWD